MTVQWCLHCVPFAPSCSIAYLDFPSLRFPIFLCASWNISSLFTLLFLSFRFVSSSLTLSCLNDCESIAILRHTPPRLPLLRHTSRSPISLLARKPYSTRFLSRPFFLFLYSNKMALPPIPRNMSVKHAFPDCGECSCRRYFSPPISDLKCDRWSMLQRSLWRNTYALIWFLRF